MPERCVVGPGLAKALETRHSRRFEVVAARTPATSDATLLKARLGRRQLKSIREALEAARFR